MSQLPADSSFDKIRSYIIGKTSSLPDHLEPVRVRWTAAFTLMLDTGLTSDRQVVKQLMATFDISEAQAYVEITASKRLFGDYLNTTIDVPFIEEK